MRQIIAMFLVALFLGGCSFVMADGQTAYVVTQKQMMNEYLAGALDGCVAAYLIGYARSGKPVAEADLAFIQNACIDAAIVAWNTWRAEPLPQPAPVFAPQSGA